MAINLWGNLPNEIYFLRLHRKIQNKSEFRWMYFGFFHFFFGSRLRTLSVSPPSYLYRSCLALEGHLGLMISYVISEWV